MTIRKDNWRENYNNAIRLFRQWKDASKEKCKFRTSNDNVRVNNADKEEARLTDTIYNNKLIHEQIEMIMLKVYDNIKGAVHSYIRD